MLASLRPRSPSSLSANPHPYPHTLAQPVYIDRRGSQPKVSVMEGPGGRRYTTPPSMRTGPPPQHFQQQQQQQQHGSTSYATDAGMDPLEQRPSPQSRQRSWHHPYMQSARSAQGPSPPMSLEPGAGPSQRAYEQGHHDAHSLGPRHRSPPSYRAEHLHAPPESRTRAASRVENMGMAQPLNISNLPAHPLHDVARVGGIGPSRNRGRSSTLSLPHPEGTRSRGNSFVGNRLHSPSHGPHFGGYDEPIPPPPRSWEDGRTYRGGAFSHHAGEHFAAHRHSPNLRPASKQSPILFAPLSPRQEAHSQASRRASAHVPTKLGTPSMAPRAGHYRSRPGTPISPLNMENLSMEDGTLPSASGMAVPLSAGQQRSPMDPRARNDYFGPGASDWGRPRHMDVPGSPPSVSYSSLPRHDPREYAHRQPGMMHGDGVSPDTELPRYHEAHHVAGPPHMHPSNRGPPTAGAGYHPTMSRMELMERERMAMAQHHGMGPSGPQDHGYQSDFAAQGRHAPGSGFGNPPQHAVPVDRIAHSRRRRRPPYSYSSMITQAIASSSEGRMTLREIYTWISTNFSGYPMAGPDSQGWQNTVRHNLSLGKIFIKKARTAQDIYDSCSSGNPSQSQAARGKGGWWTLHPVVLSQIRSGQRTHNDEFDDVERLVEIENAAASSGVSTSAGLSGSTSMTPTSVSADGVPSTARTTAEPGQIKSLSRQRSYSDSIDPSADQRRPGSSQQSSTAPVSRKGSIGTNRGEPAGRTAYTSYEGHPTDRPSSGSSSIRDEMPSVLQPTSGDIADADRPGAYNRMRGHTIAVHDPPSQHRTGRNSGEYPVEAYTSVRPPPVSQTSPRLLLQARGQTVEDVEMEPSVAPHKDSSLVLQEARETLVSTKQHQKHLMQSQMDAATADDSQDGPGRMAIRGLLNS